jgi:hypothetical protein
VTIIRVGGSVGRHKAVLVVKISDRFTLERKVSSWAEHRKCTTCDNVTVR